MLLRCSHRSQDNANKQTDFPLIKEPKEEEMTEEEKAAQKARPIATNPIPGTPWYAHHITAHGISPLHFLFLFFHHLCMCVYVLFFPLHF